MNPYILVFAGYAIVCLVIAFLSVRKLGFETWILTSFAIGWVIDPLSVLGILPYVLQIFAGGLMILKLLFFRNHETTKSQKVNRNLNIVAFFSIALAFVQLAVALYLRDTVEGSVRFILLAVAAKYLTTLTMTQAKNAVNLVGWLLFATSHTVVAGAVFGIESYASSESVGIRFGGIIGHPNYAGYVAAFCSIMFFSGFSKQRYFPFLTSFAIVLVTAARTALSSLIAGLLIELISRGRNRIQSILLASLAASALVLTSFGANISERFSWFFNTGGITGENSFGWRVLQWQVAIDHIVSSNGTPVGWNDSGSVLLSQLQPHDFFIQSMLELGIFGCISSLGLFFSIASLIARAKGFRFALPILIFGSLLDAGVFVPSFAFCALVLPVLFAKSEPEKANSVRTPKRLPQNSLSEIEG